MSAIKLQSLSLLAFRSFASHSWVEFPQSGLVLVDGNNKDTGGSSGSGKSSVNLGIQYAITAGGPPATALQSWMTEDPVSVMLTLKSGEQTIGITRGKKGLSVAVDGVLFNGNSKASEEKLASLFPFPLKLLETLTYRPQKTRNSFLLLSDADKKEFLSLVLGLDKIESILEASEKTSSELQKKLDTQRAVVDGMIPQLKILESQLQDVTELNEKLDEAKKTRDIRSQELAEAKSKLKTLSDEIKERRDHVSAKWMKLIDETKVAEVDTSHLDAQRKLLNDCGQRVQALDAAEAAAIAAVKSETAQLQKKLTAAKVAVSERTGLNLRVQVALKEMASLEKNVCPTCNQSWQNALEKLDQLDGEISGIREKLKTIDTLEKEIPNIEAEIASKTYVRPESHTKMASVLADLQVKVAEAQATVNSQKLLAKSNAELAKADLKAAMNQELQQADEEKRSEISNVQEKINASSLEVGVLDADINNLLSQLTIAGRAVEGVSKLKAQILQKDEEMASIKALLGLELDLQAALGRTGFLNAIQAEILAEISAEANTILANVPNVSHVSIDFQTEKTTQKGTVKSVITPIIRISGQEASFAAGLSGGQQTSVDLAVDLAVIEVVRRRTGAAPNWLILDEPFDGMDFVSKEALMEVLGKFSQDRLILIVDHGTEFKEMFSSVITVNFESGQSSFY